MKVAIAERTEELLALPLIFQQFRQLGRAPESAGNELLAAVKLYNSVPMEDEPIYREAIIREYARFCRERRESARPLPITPTSAGQVSTGAISLWGMARKLSFPATPDAQGHAGVLTPEMRLWRRQTPASC